ncbi:MAG: hypothetical protein JWR10_2369 [Rubritepida sp.]|nr:hypothetical protein [Rubritepida sp.]
MIGWWRLGRELDRWAAAGHKPRLWWRDDDACDGTPALERLVELSERFKLPLVLAVIPLAGPREGLQRLAELLGERRAVFTCQHGVTHENRRHPGEADTEFRADEAPERIAEELVLGRSRMAVFPGHLPLYVPPWNAAHRALLAALPLAGFTAFSGSEETALPGLALRQAHAQLDPLRWKPTPCFRGHGRCLSRLRRLLRTRRRMRAWREPIGLLTHHLVHDPETWIFLEGLLTYLHADLRVQWPSPADMFGTDWS